MPKEFPPIEIHNPISFIIAVIAIVSITLSLTSCCPNNAPTSRYEAKISEAEKLWIPDINSPLTFIDNNGELMVFDDVSTKLEYRKLDFCGPEDVVMKYILWRPEGLQ